MLMLLGVLLSHDPLYLLLITRQRSTAKKFLAAANFLEVLKTFPKSDTSESESVRFSLLINYIYILMLLVE